MKPFLILVLAALTAWVAFTAAKLESARTEAGVPVVRREKNESPAVKKLRDLAEEHGTRQVLLGGIGVIAGLILAFTTAMKILRIIAIGCALVMAAALWLAWQRGWLAGFGL